MAPSKILKFDEKQHLIALYQKLYLNLKSSLNSVSKFNLNLCLERINDFFRQVEKSTSFPDTHKIFKTLDALNLSSANEDALNAKILIADSLQIKNYMQALQRNYEQKNATQLQNELKIFKQFLFFKLEASQAQKIEIASLKDNVLNSARQISELSAENKKLGQEIIDEKVNNQLKRIKQLLQHEEELNAARCRALSIRR